MSLSNNPRVRLAELRQRWDADRRSRIFLQLAEEYRRQGQQADAIGVLEVGLSHNPSSLAGQVALGRCLMEIGRYPDARDVLEAVLDKDPTQMVAYRHLVETHLALGESEEASHRLSIYEQLNPSDESIPSLEQRIREVRLTQIEAPAADPEVPELVAPAAPREDGELASRTDAVGQEAATDEIEGAQEVAAEDQLAGDEQDGLADEDASGAEASTDGAVAVSPEAPAERVEPPSAPPVVESTGPVDLPEPPSEPETAAAAEAQAVDPTPERADDPADAPVDAIPLEDALAAAAGPDPATSFDPSSPEPDLNGDSVLVYEPKIGTAGSVLFETDAVAVPEEGPEVPSDPVPESPFADVVIASPVTDPAPRPFPETPVEPSPSVVSTPPSEPLADDVPSAQGDPLQLFALEPPATATVPKLGGLSTRRLGRAGLSDVLSGWAPAVVEPESLLGRREPPASEPPAQLSPVGEEWTAQQLLDLVTLQDPSLSGSSALLRRRHAVVKGYLLALQRAKGLQDA